METTILYSHISLNVRNIGNSLNFYKAFFGVEPVKVRSDYAKFELQNPKLNFTINERAASSATDNQVLNHFGFQVETTDDVLVTDLRLRKLGLRTVEEEKTVCCYALQDKIWVEDPDGVSWEVFVVHSDADSYLGVDADKANAVCCVPAPVSINTSLAA